MLRIGWPRLDGGAPKPVVIEDGSQGRSLVYISLHKPPTSL